jgi:hypothetical protein
MHTVVIQILAGLAILIPTAPTSSRRPSCARTVFVAAYCRIRCLQAGQECAVPPRSWCVRIGRWSWIRFLACPPVL